MYLLQKHRWLNAWFIFMLAIVLPVGVVQPVKAAEGATAELVKDIVLGDGFSDPQILAEFQGLLLFEAYTPATGRELWRSDGTANGTSLLKDIWPEQTTTQARDIEPVAEFNGAYYFRARNAAGVQLWKTDGTVAGTVAVATTSPTGSSDTTVGGVVFNNRLFFLVDGGSQYGAQSTLWSTDGTSAGTVPLVYAGHEPDVVEELLVANGKLFFAVGDVGQEDGVSREAVYSTDGTVAGTVKLLENDGGGIGQLIALGNKVVFSARIPGLGNELWQSDGTLAGTTVVIDLAAGQTSGVSISSSAPFKFNNAVYFVGTNRADGVDDELWRSDGTAAGTYRVKDIFPGPDDSSIENPVVGDSFFYFTAITSTAGRELWRSDGTEAGTVQVKDITPGATGANPRLLVANGDLLFFTVGGSITNLTLWRSDGSEAGTVEVKLLGSPTFAQFGPLVVAPGGIVFLYNNGEGKQIWFSNGEAGQTYALTDPETGTPLLVGTEILATLFSGSAGGTFFFAAYTSSKGRELWKLSEGDLPAERVTDGLLAFYDFEEGSGNTIRDTSGVGTALNLRVARSFTHQWVDGGLRLKGLTVLRTNGAASKIIQAARTNNALTIEAWITPADVEQFSSRIITVSPNTTVRNFTLSQGSFTRQESSEALFRLRSTGTKNDGKEWTSGAGALGNELVHLVVTLASDGQVRIYVDGEVVTSSTYAGTLSNWNTSYPLLLGNEALGGRGWKGTYYLVAFYDRALSASEVQQNFNVGP
jgi:ELWxxDGT repeat protein